MRLRRWSMAVSFRRPSDRGRTIAGRRLVWMLRSTQRLVVCGSPSGVPQASAPGWAEGTDSLEWCSEGWRFAEIPAAFGLPLPPLAAVAGAALLGPFDLGGGELEAGPDLIGLDLGHRPLLALGGFPAALAESAGDHDPVALGERVGQVLGLGAPHVDLEERGLAVAPLTILLDALGHGDAEVGDGGAGVGEADLGGVDQVAGDGGLVVGCHWLCSLLDADGAGLAFGAEPLGTMAATGLEPGGTDGVGGPVVLAGQPHHRVGVVLAAGGDGDAGAEDEGGFAVAQGLAAVGVLGVGGDAVVGVEPVKGLPRVGGGRRGLGGAWLGCGVGGGVLQVPGGVGGG